MFEPSCRTATFCRPDRRHLIHHSGSAFGASGLPQFIWPCTNPKPTLHQPQSIDRKAKMCELSCMFLSNRHVGTVPKKTWLRSPIRTQNHTNPSIGDVVEPRQGQPTKANRDYQGPSGAPMGNVVLGDP